MKEQNNNPNNFKGKDTKSNPKSIEDFKNQLKGSEPNKKQFPLEIFPTQIQQLIENAHETKPFNRDYLSAGILSVCASAIGNSVDLHNGTYNSKPILWVAIVGSRGTGKTHPLSYAIKPLDAKDSEAYKGYKELLKEFENEGKDSKSSKPKYKQFILKDFTPEKLAETLQYNEKGILIFQDELMRWINSFDQYKKGGDQQLYLELFNGNALTVDRVTKDPIRVEKTNVNILGGMQPEILKGIAKNGRGDDGFLDRFLFVYPEITEPNLYTGNDIDPIYTRNYTTIIDNLLGCHDFTVSVDANGIETFKQWQHSKATECFNDKLDTVIQAKLETYVWRFTLIIELMDQAVLGEFKKTVSNSSLKKAITLVEYFRYNALKVHDRLLSNDPLSDLTPLQIEIYKSLPYKFKRADVLPLFKDRKISVPTGDRFLKKTKLFHSSKTRNNLKLGEYQKVAS